MVQRNSNMSQMLEEITGEKYNVDDALLQGRNRDEHDERLEGALICR